MSNEMQRPSGSILTRWGLPIFGLGLVMGAAYAILRPERLIAIMNRISATLAPASSDPDHALIAEIRKSIDPLISNPGAITIQSRDGQIILKGPILKSEVRALHAGLNGLTQIRGIVDLLEVHETSEGVPGLQGRSEWHIPGGSRQLH